MTAISKQDKLNFWLKWTFLSFGYIPLSYVISLIAVLLVHGAFGFNQMEGGTYLSQTLMQIAGGAVIGLGTGLFQKSLLKTVIKVTSSWIYTLVIGFVITELVVCIILWQLNLNRWELRFIESNPLPESLIFACAGLTVGMMQWQILRRHFSGSVFWVLASTLGWGICVLVTLISIWAFLLGALLYGAITGAALMWVLQAREAGVEAVS